ncbi:hypothetical protein J1605_013063 [Eschrichtius robustus]|uniref:Uncharacterized protein n=1 Tax=Eschrichtius robustus TaxID=9764 RepID=A0AB34GGQ9_ESCRO|nr:hypothetical protein J1605_013063 [Eschrichtius robustus]
MEVTCPPGSLSLTTLPSAPDRNQVCLWKRRLWCLHRDGVYARPRIPGDKVSAQMPRGQACTLISQLMKISKTFQPWQNCVAPLDFPCASHIRHFSVTVCRVPICSLYGAAVTTVKGVGSIKMRLHPVQVKAHLKFLIS